MTKQYNKPWLSDIHKSKIVLWMICEFLRTREDDTTREWGAGTKEYRLIEFQQWIGEKIPPETEEIPDWPSNTYRARKKRRLRANQKLKKEDYEEYLRQLRERVRKNI